MNIVIEILVWATNLLTAKYFIELIICLTIKKQKKCLLQKIKNDQKISNSTKHDKLDDFARQKYELLQKEVDSYYEYTYMMPLIDGSISCSILYLIIGILIYFFKQ